MGSGRLCTSSAPGSAPKHCSINSPTCGPSQRALCEPQRGAGAALGGGGFGVGAGFGVSRAGGDRGGGGEGEGRWREGASAPREKRCRRGVRPRCPQPPEPGNPRVRSVRERPPRRGEPGGVRASRDPRRCVPREHGGRGCAVSRDF